MFNLATIPMIVFWLCAALIIYTYVFYAPLIWCLSRVLGRDKSQDEYAGELPHVSLLIAAHNEEAVMDRRLLNALAMDYPPERFEIVVASDASSDGTGDIVRRYVEQGVRLIEFAERRGKSAALNRAIPQLRGEIVILSDANTEMESSAARKLIRWFGDPSVGVVCGRLVLADPHTGRNADSLYWKYETALKLREARLGALLGANGGIYAFRRSIYVPIPDATIVDDFAIPLLAKLRSGCSILYDVEAVAREETAPDVGEEFRRRARIGVGNCQNLMLLWPLLNPLRGFIALSFFSHKVLRWSCPFFLLGLFVSSILLWNHPFYRIALITQSTMYGAAVAILMLPRRLKLPKYLRLAVMFVSMNAALLVGFCRWLFHLRSATWQPTARPPFVENRSA